MLEGYTSVYIRIFS